MSKSTHDKPIKATLHASLLFTIIWSVLVLGSYVLNVKNDIDSTQKLAEAEAKSHFKKDLLFRKWNAGHGGVYVEPTDESPANEYLSHLKERDLVTTTGKKLTLINPAYMTRQTHELAAKELGVKGHITSLNPIRPQNKPDEWESKILKLFESGVTEISSIEYIHGVKFMRYMGALRTEASCLKCHSQQGYKIGDIRGGISVSVPYKKYDEILSQKLLVVSLGYLSVWLVGLITIGVGFRYISKTEATNREIVAETQKLELRNMLLSSLSEGVYGVDELGKLTFINQAALDVLNYEEYEVIGKNPHELFHYKRPDGTPYPYEECPSEKSVLNGIKYSCEDMLFDKNGKGIEVEMSTVPILQNGIPQGAVVTFKDISQRVKMLEELEALAKEDFLTGISNRRVFMESLKQDFAIFRRKHVNSALIVLDLDHFKNVNDTYGHAVGDEVLKAFARVATDEIRTIDTLARIGGEEFGIILRQTNLDGATDFAIRLKNEISKIVVESDECHVKFSASMGISMFEAQDEHEDEVLLRADKALYNAKNLGRNRIEIL